MERKGLVLGMLAAALAAGLSTGAGAQDKKDAGAATGPYGLPSFAAVKDKVKPTDDEAKKIEEVYAQGSKNEAESQNRIETMNKVKEVLDKDKSKLFDDLCRASQPDKKKK